MSATVTTQAPGHYPALLRGSYLGCCCACGTHLFAHDCAAWRDDALWCARCANAERHDRMMEARDATA